MLNRNRAHPPSPPGLAPTLGDIDEHAEELRKTEADRGIMQVMDATGVGDLRTILVIRRASHSVSQPVHHEPQKGQDDDIWFGIWSQSEPRTQSDEEDEGGEEGLAKSEDKVSLRVRRSFELLLTTGRVIRFEVISNSLAIFSPLSNYSRLILAGWLSNGSSGSGRLFFIGNKDIASMRKKRWTLRNLVDRV